MHHKLLSKDVAEKTTCNTRKKKNLSAPRTIQNYSEFPKSLITGKKGTTPFLVVFFRASATNSLSET